MSQNEGEPDIDDKLEDLPDPESDDYKNVDWKARAEKAEGIAKRNKTKLDKIKKDSEKPPEKKEPEKKEGEKPNTDDRGFDRVDRSNLKSEGITDDDELDLVSEIMKETGKDVEAVLNSRYFKTELKGMRDDKAAAEGTPKNNRRVGNQSKTDVDYWIAKGELPPMDQPDLRQKVVNEKMKREKAKEGFSKNPVII